MDTEKAWQEFARLYFEETGKHISEEEARDIQDIAQLFAEIAYESWKKKVVDSKKSVPGDP
ncbi:MAG: hypothetical protein A3C50_01250 [Candidatus Staskawiczbacteria bacterium RIFCSPHIGHO2_02_FULL_43_16]|uniref:Uncharacterized protein n=1 Tax=Candidatus Staskawiczbacteria bacterium RIFCSPHIGHO2_01_FULL_41_41 TaxID=1802203 RepID=A0A1G2HUV7_9BACT|nr:MAG: hypothetical protein A2822_04665 [Candidatus Staskawiczbacteria bacterium RIFCSPHIGHO2_01_FULL_41_41]OGZ68835.1 MAG: hypothetical protein A3C50_01250 [Candidatus Staskawiczbacteria bacterium RIFCSPHIGHO2_02_FULL_43_16]OGZ74208.1 MAG: hypothetical protein A3A12_00240 [Candidatus Staskawiczbacteria bacterium RIFCSPLOWO2_01_FULL_43_17b]